MPHGCTCVWEALAELRWRKPMGTSPLCVFCAHSREGLLSFRLHNLSLLLWIGGKLLIMPELQSSFPAGERYSSRGHRDNSGGDSSPSGVCRMQSQYQRGWWAFSLVGVCQPGVSGTPCGDHARGQTLCPHSIVGTRLSGVKF